MNKPNPQQAAFDAWYAKWWRPHQTRRPRSPGDVFKPLALDQLKAAFDAGAKFGRDTAEDQLMKELKNDER